MSFILDKRIRWILNGEKHFNVHQDAFRILLKMLVKYFNEFFLKLKEACFVIVCINKSSFSSTSFPLYSWMPKGWDTERAIRPSSKRYNAIAAQWDKKSYFVIKSDSTNEASFIKFVSEFDKELRIKLKYIWKENNCKLLQYKYW